MEEVNKMNEYEKIDEIVLRHTQRGMHILREHQKSGLCESAAREILSWEKERFFSQPAFMWRAMQRPTDLQAPWYVQKLSRRLATIRLL